MILGIESSCDDTSAAVLCGTEMLSNVIASQAVHMQYGGVIPELASRAHQQNIVPVVDTALKNASVGVSDLDAIAFTRGPACSAPCSSECRSPKDWPLQIIYRSWRSIICRGIFCRISSIFRARRFRILRFRSCVCSYREGIPKS